MEPPECPLSLNWGSTGGIPPFRVIFRPVEYDYDCPTYGLLGICEFLAIYHLPGRLHSSHSDCRADPISAAGVAGFEWSHSGEDVPARTTRVSRDSRSRLGHSTNLCWIASLSSTGQPGRPRT